MYYDEGDRYKGNQILNYDLIFLLNNYIHFQFE